VIRLGVRRALSLALRRRDRWEREVEDEIKLHLTLRAEQLQAQGRAPDEAYTEALRRFGSLDASRRRLLRAAEHREKTMHHTEIVADLKQDIAFAWRTLARQKAWTTITVLTLGLGMGATTAVFSVVSTLLIHRMPYPHGERIVNVSQQPSSGNNTGVHVSIIPQNNVIEAWQHDAHSFEAVQTFSIVPKALKTTSGEDGRAWTAAITAGMFDFADVRPIRGRLFNNDEAANDTHVALLGESFWRNRLGADSSVLGKMITLSDTSYVVVGVMPGAFRVTAPGRALTDVWLPLNLKRKGVRVSGVVGRLRPGVTIPVAQRELDSVFARVGGFKSGDIPFKAALAHPSEGASFKDSLLLLTGAVGLLLLVACTNVAHLLLARTATRQREIAIRTALGAASGRLFRQLLTESFLLCAGGAVAGVGLGWIGLKALIALRPHDEVELTATHVDLTTLQVTLGVTVLSAIIFGVIGAFETRRHSANDTLKGGSLATTATRGHRRLRAALVVSEIALSVMLVVGAGLVIRSLRRMQQTDLGFSATNLYSLAPASRPRDDAGNVRLLAETFAKVRAVPGVRDASIAETPPGWSSFSVGRLEIDGEPAPPSTSSSFIAINHVQASYFATMRIALLEGTTFTDTTNLQTVVVNDAFARKHWPRGKAIGQRLRIAQKGDEPWLSIVGIAHDAMTNGPTTPSDAPLFYLPRSDANSGAILVRTNGGVGALQSIVTAPAAHGVNPATIAGVSEFVSQSISEPRFVMLVMTAFGFVGLLLASIGLYGVMAYTVAQESRDIGVRVALGASRSHVMRGVLIRGATLALTGVVAGLAAAAWGTKLVEAHLFGIERLDPITFAGGAAVLIAAALIACIVPTRRALAVDPIAAIRAD
jgi:putative ABC transport system permease protein